MQALLDIFSRHLLSPIQTLRRDIGRRDDTDVRIDKEKHQGARMSRLSLVLQLEASELVFYSARVHDDSAYVAADRTWVLDGRLVVLHTEDLPQPDEIVWLVLDFGERVGFYHVAELHGRIDYVGVVVCYECRGADVLVLIS